MVKAVLVATDEGDEGASPLLDMTKVTRSTPADKGYHSALSAQSLKKQPIND